MRYDANHIHMLVAFRNEAALIDQCESWKRYTATRINRWLKRNVVVNPENRNPCRASTGKVSSGGCRSLITWFETRPELERYRRYIAEDNLERWICSQTRAGTTTSGYERYQSWND